MGWNGRCVVVMLRRAESDKHGDGLEAAIRDAALRSGAPDTLYTKVRASSSDEGEFPAWNIAYPDLLRELLGRRGRGETDFRAYYRFCSGISTVSPEGEFFRGS